MTDAATLAPVALQHALDEAQFGGKSVQLGASLRAGLPVPVGWALSADFVTDIAQRDATALGTLEAFLHDKPEPIAVRSSGVGEDAEGASFAGQHVTELNRIGASQVADAVRAVWHSAHGAGALAYRAKHDLHQPPRMAVTLQQMVFPDCAGVMFTRHPVTGAHEILIEASWGLGEAVVDGLVVPDRFRLSSQGVVLESTPGTKDLMIQPLPGGQVEEVAIDDAQRVHGLCLDAAQLALLAHLAGQCDMHFGPGRDIEWGIANGVLSLLQCRAITTLAATLSATLTATKSTAV